MKIIFVRINKVYKYEIDFLICINIMKFLFLRLKNTI